jgi:transposase
MAKGFRPVQRDQPMLVPPDLREWLPAGHLALLVIDVVEKLDLSALRKAYRLGGVGREAYDPSMMTALLVYAYCQGMRSSRGIERACVTDVACRVLSAQQFPDHSTIARFRKDHAQALAGLFGQVLGLCHGAGMVRVGTVAVDSVKIAANASPRKNYTAAKYRKLAEEMLAEAAALDAVEDAEHGDASGDELPDDLAPGTDRARRIQECLDKLAAQKDDAIAADLTRAEARVRRAQAGEAGVRAKAEARHAGRAARSTRRPVGEHKTVRGAAAKVAQARADVERARAGGGPAAAAAETNRCNITDPDSRIMPLPNKGWVQGFNAQLAVSGDHVIVTTGISTEPNDAAEFVPMMDATVANTEKFLPGKDIGTMLADTSYCVEAALTAQGPDRLIATGRDPAKPAKDPARAAMAERLTEGTPGRETYKRRAATVEPVIGHLKDRLKLTRFSRRGKQAAEHELAFAATCHNIRRLATTKPRLAT